MSDISIGKYGSESNIGNSVPNTKYQQLKRDYQKFLQQAEKSDMQNSLTFKQKQLEMLEALKKAAEEEGVRSDCDLIASEIESLKLAIGEETKDGEQISASYMPPLQLAKPKSDLVSLVNACKNSKGEVDEETRRIVLAFKDTDVAPRNLAKFVDKCRGVEEVIEMETVVALEKLCAAGVSPNLIFDAVDDMPILASNEIGKIDFSWVDDLLAYKEMKIDESDALKFARRLNSDYENKKDVYASVVKMMDAGFGVDMTSQLISAFTVKNSETGKATFPVKSVNSVLNMKKMLSSSHSVERDERQNPISKLGQILISFDDSVYVMKDDRVIEIIDLKEKSYHKELKKYEEAVTLIENNIISDFVSAYTTEDGNLDQSALRVFSALRSAGVSYGQLLPILKASLQTVPEDESGVKKKAYDIDVDKVNTITALKQSGALSADVLTIIDAITKGEDGKYSSKEVDNACYLTELIIGGKEVAELLPEVSADDQVKDFVSDFATIVDNTTLLLPLTQLTKDSSGKFDDDAAEVLYSLAERFLVKEDDKMKEADFLPYAEKVIEASKSQVTNDVDDNCLNVCIAMCKNNESSDNILQALELCRDEYGYPNEALADIVWDMSKQGASFDKIVELINICKPVNGILDVERAALIADLLDNNCSIDDVMSVAQGLGHN